MTPVTIHPLEENTAYANTVDVSIATRFTLTSGRNTFVSRTDEGMF
jgi:ATP-dependent RNA circularization protein (DNA/RNA ligase family)